MERETNAAELIELGTASVETQGPIGLLTDAQLGQFVEGLSDD